MVINVANKSFLKPYKFSTFSLNKLMYKTISTSEATSRLNLHIKTAQDFLEGLEALGIVSKEEVFKKKRPYFRYTLIEERIRIEIDLKQSIVYFLTDHSIIEMVRTN